MILWKNVLSKSNLNGRRFDAEIHARYQHLA